MYDGTMRFDSSLDASGMQKSASQMAKVASAAFAAIGAAALAALTAIGKVGIQYNAQMEEYTTNFATMLGSQEAAIEKVAALKEMAAKTPFGMEDLAKGTQTLLAFGIESDKTQEILRQIGDVALGDKGKFEGLTLAFSQMSASGRLMGQDLLQMINAGFNPLQVISEQTGKSMAVLKKEMEEGAISSEMVAEAFKIATSEGGKFYNGMEAASHTLRGQWSTLQDDAAAAAGVMFQPFNNLLTSQVLPNIIGLVADLNTNLSSAQMQGAMTKIAQGIGKLIEGAVKFASAALPPLISALSAVITAMETLAPAMAIVAVGFAAYKTFTFILNFYEGLVLIKAGYVALLGTEAAATAGTTAALWAYNLAQNAKMIALLPLNAAIIIYNLLTGASIPLLGGAAAAQWGLNAAMLANPVGALVAGIAALVAGIVALIMWLGKGSEAYQKEKEEVEALTTAQEELATSTEESATTYESASAEIAATATVASDLTASLREVANSTASAEDKNRQMADTVAQLNGAVDGLNIAYDEETGSIRNINTGQEISIEQLEELVAAKSELAQANAWQERYNELISEQNRIQEELAVIEAKKAEILANNALSTYEQNRLIAELNTAAEGHAATMEDVQLRLDVVNQNIATSNTTMAEGVVSEYDQIQAAVTESGQSVHDVAAQWGVSVDEILAAMERENISLDGWVSNQEAAFADLEATVQEKTSGVVNSFKEIPGEFDMTAQEMLGALQANKERYAAWERNMEEITRQLGPTAAEEFRSLGPEANSAMEEILGSTELLAQYRDVFGVTIDEATGAAVENWNDPAFIGAPSEAVDSSAQIVATNPALTEAVTGQVEQAHAAMTTAVETYDFTSIGQSIADDIVNGIKNADMSSIMSGVANAIRNGSGSVTSATSSLSTSVRSVLTTMSTLAQSTVSSMMTNINSTIVTRAGTIRASITSMGNGITMALTSAKTQATSIAQQMMTAINTAIVTRTAMVKSSATSAANGIATALQTMREKGETAAEQMMTRINTAIITRSATVKSAASAVATGIENALESMVSGGSGVANRMMDGILAAMNNKAGSLYAKAKEIADNIAKTMSAALEVKSPSRVMIGIFENVMMGVYKGMDNMTGLLYTQAGGISNEIAERLMLSPGVADELAERLRAIVEFGAYNRNTLMPATAVAGGGGGITYVTNLTLQVTTPKPLSESELTREGQDLLRRAKHLLP